MQIRAPLFALVTVAWAAVGCDGGETEPSPSGQEGAVETNVAPAPCDSDDDCGTGGPCMIEAGDSLGYCAVREMIVGEGGPVEPEHGEPMAEPAPHPAPDSCATVRCATGTHCKAGRCVADAPHGSCGPNGACPGEGTCVGRPPRGCDPNAPHARCSAKCECMALGVCVEGHHWDSSPEVCACVPDQCLSIGLCVDGYHWDDSPEVCACVPDQCLSIGLCVEGYHWNDSPGVCACVPDECLSIGLCVTGYHWDDSPAVCACVPD